MSIIRSYFNKSNNIVKGVYSNSSKNPVMEISAFGSSEKIPSRYLFDIDLTLLNKKISNGIINQNNCKHYLNMTNTIRYSHDYIGNKSYNNIVRASSFDLDVFNIKENWDEGSGYDFSFNSANVIKQAPNWYERANGQNWSVEGVDATELIGQQSFETGNENIKIDITDYINQRIFTGYTGTTSYSGETFGLGIKFPDVFENLIFTERQSVAFHSKNTNTFYVPYIETVIDDVITDDRNCFYLDNNNLLYLYLTNINTDDVVNINNVEIYDHNNIIYSTITDIVKIKNDLYKINLNISSTQYPDCIIFNDKWSFNINGKDMSYTGDFYIQPNETNKYLLTQSNQFNLKNCLLSLYGIKESERIVAGEVKRIRVAVRSIYESMPVNKPINVKYRLYTKVNKRFEISIIDETDFNRTAFGYSFDLDTSWLIPQDYFLEVLISDDNKQTIKSTVSFTIIDNINVV